MTIFSLGSINADHLYRVPHLPGRGETIFAVDRSTGLGGKGANQSVAAALAGSNVVHIGAVGPDGGWAIDRLSGFGVDTTHIAVTDTPTAHANIALGDDGENSIVVYPGANHCLDLDQVRAALSRATPQDILVAQNETNLQVEAARLARDKGLRVIYSAAPFSVAEVQRMLPHVSTVAMNAVEAEQLATALGAAARKVPEILITRGANGADWHNTRTGETLFQPAFAVTATDTTGAGDTFAGVFAAGLDQGLSTQDALRNAAAAAALMVTRTGTADVIPTAQETRAFLDQRP